MQFQIMSRTKARNYFSHSLDHDCAVISITDVGSEPVRFPQSERMNAILRLSFDDTDAETAEAISMQDADKIISFVSHMKDTVEEIIVHCEAGVSRSAGVCAALMLWLIGSDKPVFENACYRPNMRCYRFVLNSIEAMNTGRIGGFEEILERPEYVIRVQQMLASGMTSHQAKLASGLSPDEFNVVFAYIHHLEICRCVPVKDGEILPQEKPMAYEKFKENYKG